MLAAVLAYCDRCFTGGSLTKATDGGFLALIRESERLSGRRPDLEEVGRTTGLILHSISTPFTPNPSENHR